MRSKTSEVILRSRGSETQRGTMRRLIALLFTSFIFVSCRCALNPLSIPEIWLLHALVSSARTACYVISKRAYFTCWTMDTRDNKYIACGMESTTLFGNVICCCVTGCVIFKSFWCALVKEVYRCRGEACVDWKKAQPPSLNSLPFIGTHS